MLKKNKLNSLTKNNYNLFLGRTCFTSNDRSQNTFYYQSTLDTLELKKEKGSDYILSWKSNGVYNSQLKPLYTAFLHTIKFSEYRNAIKFDKEPLAVEQKKNYLSKTVNFYIVYDLDAWPRNPTSTSKFKNCLFGAISILKNSDKEKYVYSGYRTTTVDAGSWSFDNNFARNAIIFGVDNSSSSHSENRKNNFSVLDEVPTFGINGSFGSSEKKMQY